MHYPRSLSGASLSLPSTPSRMARAIRIALLVSLLLAACLLLCSGTNAAATSAPAPSLVINPSVGPPTTSIRIAGSGFDPYASVDIYFDATRLATTTANGAGVIGGGSIHGALAVQAPASAIPGGHWITAMERSGGRLARKQFLVRTDWAQFHFDAGHSGLNPYENVLSPANVGGLQLDWSYRTGGAISSSPVVANGAVYVASTDGNLYALNATTGALLWSFPGGGSPAVANGVAYVSSGNLYALNANTGALLWTFPGPVGSPTVANSVVYLGCGFYVCAVNAATGALLWQYTNIEGISDLAVGNGYVYFGSEDPSNWDQGTFYVLDAGTGALVWSQVVGNSQNGYVGFSTPAVGGGQVCVNVLTSLQQQQYASLFCLGGGGQHGFNAPASAPAVAYGMVYDGVSAYSYGTRHFPATLYAMSGGVLWDYVPSGSSISPQALANGVIYFGAGYLYALNANTGALLWQYPVEVESSPVVVNGVVYVGSGDGNIYAFGLTGGGRGK